MDCTEKHIEIAIAGVEAAATVGAVILAYLAFRYQGLQIEDLKEQQTFNRAQNQASRLNQTPYFLGVNPPPGSEFVSGSDRTSDILWSNFEPNREENDQDFRFLIMANRRTHAVVENIEVVIDGIEEAVYPRMGIIRGFEIEQKVWAIPLKIAWLRLAPLKLRIRFETNAGYEDLHEYELYWALNQWNFTRTDPKSMSSNFLSLVAKLPPGAH